MDDQLVVAARALTPDDIRILTRFAARESASDIAINLEMRRPDVVRVIREKGRDNPAYAFNVLNARRELTRAVIASRPGTQPKGVIHDAGDRLAVPHVPKPPSKRRPPTPKPAEAVTPAPEPAQEPVDLSEDFVQAGPAVTADEPTALAEAAADAPTTGEDPPMPAQTRTPAPPRTVPAPRTADLPLDRPQPDLPTPDGDPALPERFEDILALTDSHTSQKVRDIGAQLREHLDALRAALTVEHRAAAIRAQIADLDDEIAGLRSEIEVRQQKSSELRQQLEELLTGGDVVVSASSKPRRGSRPPTAAADPDGDDPIRQWARENNFQLGRGGDIPNGVRAAYHRAQEERK